MRTFTLVWCHVFLSLSSVRSTVVPGRDERQRRDRLDGHGALVAPSIEPQSRNGIRKDNPESPSSGHTAITVGSNNRYMNTTRSNSTSPSPWSSTPSSSTSLVVTMTSTSDRLPTSSFVTSQPPVHTSVGASSSSVWGNPANVSVVQQDPVLNISGPGLTHGHSPNLTVEVSSFDDPETNPTTVPNDECDNGSVAAHLLNPASYARPPVEQKGGSSRTPCSTNTTDGTDTDHAGSSRQHPSNNTGNYVILSPPYPLNSSSSGTFGLGIPTPVNASRSAVTPGPRLLLVSGDRGRWNVTCTVRNQTACVVDEKVAQQHFTEHGLLRVEGGGQAPHGVEGGPQLLAVGGSGEGAPGAGNGAQAEHEGNPGAAHRQQGVDNDGATTTFFSLEEHEPQTELGDGLSISTTPSGPTESSSASPDVAELHLPVNGVNLGSMGGTGQFFGASDTGTDTEIEAGAGSGGTESDTGAGTGSSEGPDNREGARPGSPLPADDNSGGTGQPSPPPALPAHEQTPPVQAGQPPPGVPAAGQPVPGQPSAGQPPHGSPPAGHPAPGAIAAGGPGPGTAKPPPPPSPPPSIGQGAGLAGNDQSESGAGTGLTSQGTPQVGPQQPPAQQINVGGTLLNVLPGSTLELHSTATDLQSRPSNSVDAGPEAIRTGPGVSGPSANPAGTGQSVAPGSPGAPQGQDGSGGGSGSLPPTTGSPEASAAPPSGQGRKPSTAAHPAGSTEGGVLAGSPPPPPPPPSAGIPAGEESINENGANPASPVVINLGDRPVAVQPIAPVVEATGSRSITLPPTGTDIITSAGQLFSPIPSSSLSFSTSSGTPVPVAIIAPSAPPQRESTDDHGSVHTITPPTSALPLVPLKPAPPAITTTDSAGVPHTTIPRLFPSSIPSGEDSDTAKIVAAPALPPDVDIRAYHPILITSGALPAQELIPLPTGESSVNPSIIAVSGSSLAVLPAVPSVVTTSGSVIQIFPASPLFISHDGTTEAVITVPLATTSGTDTAATAVPTALSLTTSGSRVFAVIPAAPNTSSFPMTTQAGATRTFTSNNGTVWIAGPSTTVPMPLGSGSAGISAGVSGGNIGSAGNGTSYAVPTKISVAYSISATTVRVTQTATPTSGAVAGMSAMWRSRRSRVGTAWATDVLGVMWPSVVGSVSWMMMTVLW